MGDRAKLLLIVLDGLGDRPVKALNGLTPLQVAKRPNLDRLASEGATGIMDPVAPGIPVGSDTGHLAILGYDPYKYYTGRGPLEALGAGLDLKPGDLAFRCNLATIDRDWTVIDRRASRISSEESAVLSETISEVAKSLGRGDVELFYKQTVEHRGVLVLRGSKLSDKVSDMDPHKEGVRLEKVRPLEGDEASRFTAELLNKFASKVHEALERHPLNEERKEKGKRPANALLLRGGGFMPKLMTVPERYGIKAAIVAGGALYKGVCKAAGLDVLEVEGATGTLNTDLKAKFAKVTEALKHYDMVFLHIKGTDTASHDKNPALKASFIERIDSELGVFLSRITESPIICVTSDHTTASTIGEHRGDPVPILIWGEEVRRDGVSKFDEISCATGAIGRIKGTDVLNMLFDLANLTKKYGE